MSQVIRQENLFAGEDWQKVYKSFQQVDFKAYDFDALKDALITYIKTYYPEDFNDYIESSEFIAIIEMLAYLGTSLAFRVDLNTRENIIDTAERRESIIRLARMVNYQPKRNLAANGVFKIMAVQTDQPLLDADNISLTGIPIIWNDANNVNWFDQFIQVMNSAFNPTNPFGRPNKSGVVNNINTDLYTLNNVLGLEVAYHMNAHLNGETVPIDIVNPDFNDFFFERHPNQHNAFNMIYRNDQLGAGSNNTGFFFYFRQGTLNKTDFNFEFPVPNRLTPILATNINQTDVYVQEINSAGAVLTYWTKVPSLVGTNVMYNNLDFSIRDIYEVISGTNDTITLKFPDGNFGNVPTGIMRCWHRSSIGRNVIMRPEDINGAVLIIPYFGADGMEYNLRLTYGLEYTVSNSAPAESIEQIRTRAPQVFYTQDRMVNNEDYNVYPLTRGNEILKNKAINRTYAGHSRYIDLNDPTGFHQDLIIFGEDGVIYKDDSNVLTTISLSVVYGEVSTVLLPAIQTQMQDKRLNTFYYQNYVPLIPDMDTDMNKTPYGYWKTKPDTYENTTGYFSDLANAAIPLDANNYQYIRPGAFLTFDLNGTEHSVSVRAITNNGIPLPDEVSKTGPVQLSTTIVGGSKIMKVLPAFRTVLNQQEAQEISGHLDEKRTFGMVYDYTTDKWVIDLNATNNPNDMFDSLTDWLLFIKYNVDSNSYEIISRGTVYVFGSEKSVRFYWDKDWEVYDSVTGQGLQDVIEILPMANIGADGQPLEKSIYWTFYDVFIEADGYQDTSKIEVIPRDSDEDGVPDNPYSFDELVPPTSSVVLENTTNQVGSEYYTVWKTGWLDVTSQDNLVDVHNSTIDKKPISTGDMINLMGFGNTKPGESQQQLNTILKELNAIFNTNNINNINAAKKFVQDIEKKSFRLSDLPISYPQKFYKIVLSDSVAYTSGVKAVAIFDTQHIEKNGIATTQDTTVPDTLSQELYFKWKHYTPLDQRVDPSVTNIIDMLVLTVSYFKEVIIWKNNKGDISEYPLPPTTDELRIQFSDLNTYKMISDELVYNSGKFKLLFGDQAEPELRATFKAIKVMNALISDNELKTQIIQSIETFFDVSNWDFGETFYYTELAAYIHKRLNKYLSSVVIVPSLQSSQFGDLFEVVSNTDELFLSTATIDNVEIVKNYTESNLRM